MIPRLYDESVQSSPEALADENYNGYGFFDTVQNCESLETTDSKEYTLKMTISDKDRLASVIKPNMLIKVKANPDDTPQLFEIYSVSESNGVISVSANHISYLLENDIICRTRLYEQTGNINYLINPAENRDLTMQDVIDYLFDTNEGKQYAYFSTAGNRRLFHFASDITEAKPFKFYRFLGKTLGELMKGSEGSLIDTYGGEYHYDNYNISLNRRRGRDFSETGKVIRYGADLGSNSKSMSSDNVYTHICCKATAIDRYTEQERIIVGSPVALLTPITKFEKVKIIDVTEQLRDQWKSVRTKIDGRYTGMTPLPESAEPTVASSDYGAWGSGYDRIWAFCTGYADMLSQSNTKPATQIQVSLTIDSVSELKSMQDIRLYDEVAVILKDGTRINRVKCTSATFDCINEKYKKLGFGSKTLSLTDFILKQRR